MAPQYSPVNNPFNGGSSNNLLAQQQETVQHNNPFQWSPYASNHGLPPSFPINYIQQRPPSHLMQQNHNEGRTMAYTQNSCQTYVEEHHTRSPPIKSEPLWSLPINSPSSYAAPKGTKTISPITPTNSSNEVDFGTEVDTLMKAIQAKSQSVQPQTPGNQSSPVVGPLTPYRQPISPYGQRKANLKLTQKELQDENGNGGTKSSKKRYQCTIENCTMSFNQKTHLVIHGRSHTGDKPYPCKEPGCGRSFSQLGNLKTHERRHTGERPYACEICHKTFAQRGNVRAHKIVHNPARPYTCQLDECGKTFSQLGNLKSHQNKFHISALRTLTQKFTSIKNWDVITATDKALWEHFATLYKNSNKGIKGRGRDRKVGTRQGGGGVWGAAIVGGDSAGWNNGSRAGSNGWGSSSATSSSGSGNGSFDDAPSERYEEQGQRGVGVSSGGGLPFSDRMAGY